MTDDKPTTSPESIGLGILGAANIARKQCRALKLIDTVKVVAVGSRDISKAQALIDEWDLGPTATAYGSYTEVLSDPRVEAVYIPLPTTLHVEWVHQAAAAGKHILLEKPIAVTAAETDEILAACAEYNVQFMDGTMWAHHPRTREMEAVLQSGRLGTVKEVVSVFTFTASPEFAAKDIRFKKDGDPLGALGDIGWYCVRGILWAFEFEAPIAVAAHPGGIFTAEGVPIALGATLIFPGGRRGIFTCSFDRALTQKLEVGGTDGTLVVDDFVLPRNTRCAEFVVTRDHGLKDNDTWDATQKDVHVVHHALPQEALMWVNFAECVNKVKAVGRVDGGWPRIAGLTQKVVSAVAESAAADCAVVQFTQSKF